jgi:hypothetical protein
MNTKRHLNEDDWKAIREKHAKFTPAETRAFIRRVMGPARRTLIGDEKIHMLTVFKLLDPIYSSNNQRSFTDVYEHAGKTFNVHWFSKDDIEVEEIIPDDIQQD